MLEMVGFSSLKEIIGKTDYDLPWRETADILQQNDKEVIKSGRLESFEETGKLSNSNTIREMAHKRQGGASYCGAKCLEQACQQIDDYIHEQGPNGQTNALYQQLIQEMEATQTVCEDYLK